MTVLAKPTKSINLLMQRTILYLVFIFSAATSSFAQDDAVIYGKVVNQDNKSVSDAFVSIIGVNYTTKTRVDGTYEMHVSCKKSFVLKVSCLGYKDTIRRIDSLKPKQRFMANMKIEEVAYVLQTQTFSDKSATNNFEKINIKTISVIPVASGDGVMGIIKTFAGVHSNNELSSQYSVRGGNYDENLVYVNDVEIYRPFLVRSGQQEGLSFVNTDMVGSVNFSAGGFEAKYGDKMSSVLDVRYKRPDKFASTISESLLGGSAQVEGTADSNKFTYMIGVRNKTSQYVLSKMATKGDYKPSFVDVQSVMVYDISKKWQLSFLGGYSNNKYMLIPESMTTSFGTVKEAMQLRVFFDGQEIDEFSTTMGALCADYKANKDLQMKFITSVFNTVEKETYDIQGEYWLDELDVDFGKDNFGKVAYNKGVGAYINHARDYLDATVYNFEHKGYFSWRASNLLQWGVKYQHEQILDKISEWNLRDSASYALPIVFDSVGYKNPFAQPKASLNLQDVVKKINTLNSDRYSAYIQNVWVHTFEKGELSVNGGVRANIWSVNKELLISPRVVMAYQPFLKNKRNVMYRLSSGVYYQPPFYREMRDFYGNLNLDLKAQRSIHILAGMDYEFKAWHRPFKFTTEAYYKFLDNIDTYEVDNVRIQYYANNLAKGYAKGLDMKVNERYRIMG